MLYSYIIAPLLLPLFTWSKFGEKNISRRSRCDAPSVDPRLSAVQNQVSVTCQSGRTVFGRLAAGRNVDVTGVTHARFFRRRDGEELALVELVKLSHTRARESSDK